MSVRDGEWGACDVSTQPAMDAMNESQREVPPRVGAEWFRALRLLTRSADISQVDCEGGLPGPSAKEP